jgi:hypothetical protein
MANDLAVSGGSWRMIIQIADRRVGRGGGVGMCRTSSPDL